MRTQVSPYRNRNRESGKRVNINEVYQPSQRDVVTSRSPVLGMLAQYTMMHYVLYMSGCTHVSCHRHVSKHTSWFERILSNILYININFFYTVLQSHFHK